MNPRHLQTRRPRKDRDVTWSRRYVGHFLCWAVWRRDHKRTLHLLTLEFVVNGDDHPPLEYMRKQVRAIHRRLRDKVDEIDLEAMETTA